MTGFCGVASASIGGCYQHIKVDAVNFVSRKLFRTVVGLDPESSVVRRGPLCPLTPQTVKSFQHASITNHNAPKMAYLLKFES
jgi:hypothetical protein